MWSEADDRRAGLCVRNQHGWMQEVCPGALHSTESLAACPWLALLVTVAA